MIFPKKEGKKDSKIIASGCASMIEPQLILVRISFDCLARSGYSPSRGVWVPLSAIDAMNPAMQHAKQQLFRPFRFGQWSRLALVGLFAGEMSSGGGCNFNRFNVASNTGNGGHRDFLMAHAPNWAALWPLILVLIIAIPILWLLFLYVSSRMRFILFDSVVAKRCEIRRMWRERGEQALQFFLWQLLLSVVSLAGMAILIGVPALGAFLAGWFSAPREHVLQLALAGVIVFFLFAAWAVLAVVVHVFTKDFVVPQMALENISAFEGWRRLLPMLSNEKGGYAGYVGMKLVLAIGGGIVVGILAFIVIIILLIPFGGLGAIAILTGATAGWTWNVFTITVAIVAGCIFLLVLFYALSLISVPLIVFFPAYSIYFFAARYPLLARLIFPAPPPAPPAAPVTPTPEPPPPPIMPSPEPIG
jgi:hypothetical protein